jgi:hypothetical protein
VGYYYLRELEMSLKNYLQRILPQGFVVAEVSFLSYFLLVAAVVVQISFLLMVVVVEQISFLPIVARINFLLIVVAVHRIILLENFEIDLIVLELVYY